MTAPSDRQPGWRTANRPLPPRSGEAVVASAAATAPAGIPSLVEAAQGSSGPLPPRPVSVPAAGAPSIAVPAATVAMAPANGSAKSRPDAKPMRVVYGAGALAAISVITVGLVQPTEQSAQSDLTASANGPTSGSGADDRRARRTNGRRTVRYVFLPPGDQAPVGARVISAAEAARRGVAPRTTVPDGTGRARGDRPRRPERGAPRDTQSAPEPRPEPPVRTRQSGG